MLALEGGCVSFASLAPLFVSFVLSQHPFHNPVRHIFIRMAAGDREKSEDAQLSQNLSNTFLIPDKENSGNDKYEQDNISV
ncbi:MAG: hypothetical protein BGO28_06860 [Alphaproteobacteria bacterium 43-37]|nr:MAG: hypothetical protein BGO28_06860 [Alphaproteobacteria bacterium 43-37]